jgi:hypothetical protein
MFKKGDKVVKILSGPGGTEAASLQVISKVTKKSGRRFASLRDSSWQVFDADTGKSLDDPIPGFTSRLVVLGEWRPKPEEKT